MVTTFYDSVKPELIPSGRDAALYYDGDLAASPAYWTPRFCHIRWITVLGDWTHCGIADFEPGNEIFDPERLRRWVEGRAQMGKRARVYCDRDNLPAARAACTGLDYLVWLATLDGDQLSPAWTPGLWAVQYAGGPDADYDISVLYGAW